jgi:hypothetical protein
MKSEYWHPARMDDVPERNRVTPFGEIVAISQRGLFMGNRGSIHRGRSIVRPWRVRRWITCRLEYKGWVAPKWEPGRWTPLFFYDEAVALAAGHRPCALCRRDDFNAWLDAWSSAFGERPRVDPMDRRLHSERVEGRLQRRHSMPWRELPVGAFVVTDEDAPALVLEDLLVPWSPDGYGSPLERPSRGGATVLTPPSTAEVLRNGYRPVVHPSAKPYRPAIRGVPAERAASPAASRGRSSAP